MILIVGAGISGLTLAYEFEKKGVEYLLVESDAAAGGYIKSSYSRDYLLELGPNTVLANKYIKSFFVELGLQDEMILPERHQSKRYVLKNGELNELPSGPLSFLFGSFFSWSTKKAVFKELFLKSAGNYNETVGQFFERRFNKELVDYAVNPFVSGIFAGDPYQLLARKTFPFLPALEKKYGSVVKGFIKSKKQGGNKETIIFKNGMNKLVRALSEKVNHAHFNVSVVAIEKTMDGFNVELCREGKSENIAVSELVLTTSSFSSAAILKKFNGICSEQISKITYSPMIKVFIGFKKKDIGRYPDGFGVLNPACERQFSLGTIWNSSTNAQSSPNDSSLFTVMVGGVNNENKTREGEVRIIQQVCEELKRIYQITAEPDFTSIYKIPKAIPQYDDKMIGLKECIDQLEKSGIYICANWYNGAAVSDCITKAVKLSERIFNNVEV